MIKDLRPQRQGKKILQEMIEEGEHVHQDFKFAISDARKIARSISAFANNDGGRLLIGVKDNGSIAGVRNDEDIYVVEQAAQMYCRPEQEIEVEALYSDGAVVYIVRIKPSARRPIKVKEDNGTWRSYFRVADENIAAHPLMVKAWEACDKDDTQHTTIDENDSRLLSIISRHGSLPLDSLSHSMRSSKSSISKSICTLYCVGLIDFQYIGNCFHVVVTE